MGVTQSAVKDLATTLVEAVPPFGAIIEEHRAEYEEIQPCVLSGDLARFVLAAHVAGAGIVIWLNQPVGRGVGR